MARKTMLRQLISKYGIMSTELQNAFEGDMAYIKEDGSKVYFDNEETPTIVEEQETPKAAKSLDEV
jgi:recombination protein RecT